MVTSSKVSPSTDISITISKAAVPASAAAVGRGAQGHDGGGPGADLDGGVVGLGGAGGGHEQRRDQRRCELAEHGPSQGCAVVIGRVPTCRAFPPSALGRQRTETAALAVERPTMVGSRTRERGREPEADRLARASASP